jgi:hypothetical protein
MIPHGFQEKVFNKGEFRAISIDIVQLLL